MTTNPLRAGLAAAALLLSGGVMAAQLTVSTYSMPNGDGNAHGGTYNYWDATYSGMGNVTQDGLSGSVLSGGTGKLTDGVIATSDWYLVSNSSGTGQYVGWRNTSPTITFGFASAVSINEIKLYVDNSHVGGVTAPSAVTVDGTSYANPSWASASLPQTIDLTGLNITGNSVSVTLTDATTDWVFLSEAQFFGNTAAVPEADASSMLLGGLAALGLMALRRRQGAIAH
jgi:hypothetical protein